MYFSNPGLVQSLESRWVCWKSHSSLPGIFSRNCCVLLGWVYYTKPSTILCCLSLFIYFMLCWSSSTGVSTNLFSFVNMAIRLSMVWEKLIKVIMLNSRKTLLMLLDNRVNAIKVGVGKGYICTYVNLVNLSKEGRHWWWNGWQCHCVYRSRLVLVVLKVSDFFALETSFGRKRRVGGLSNWFAFW